MTAKAQTSNTKTKKSGAGLMLVCIAIAALLGLSIRAFGFSLVLVRSDGMNDTLLPGDVVLLSRVAQPQAGNIVLAGARNGNSFRRVAGQPGDTVSASGGEVKRNGMPLFEPYAKGELEQEIPETHLQTGVYLLLADNRAYEAALVEGGGIAGVVRAIVWPLGRASFL